MTKKCAYCEHNKSRHRGGKYECFECLKKEGALAACSQYKEPQD